MTDRDRIVVLLEHYLAVCEGIQARDDVGDHDGLALMCREWNHPAYQRLERLLHVMHERWPRMRVAVRERFERYSERRVAYCAVCHATEPASSIGEPHLRERVAGAKLLCRIGAKAPDMLPRIVRSHGLFEGQLVEDALDWLERAWGQPVELPVTLIGFGRDYLIRAA